jgi:hypothetical protein
VNDPVSAKAASAAIAAASGGAAWWTTATQIASTLFGIPLPAVLMAALGAFGARTFVASAGLIATLRAGGLWTAIGCGLAPIIGWVLGVPEKFIGGLCLASSALLQLAWPILVKNAGTWVERFVGRFTGGGGGGGNDARP